MLETAIYHTTAMTGHVDVDCNDAHNTNTTGLETVTAYRTLTPRR